MSQRQLEEQLTEAYETFENTLNRRKADIRRSVQYVKMDVFDVLTRFSNEERLIPSKQQTAVIRELQNVENLIYRQLNRALRNHVEQSAQHSATSLNGALIATVGIPTLTSAYGLTSSAVASGEVAVVGTAFAYGLGVQLLELINAIVSSVFNRKGTDGLQLRDRLRRIAREIRQMITSSVRESIRRGENVEIITKRLDRIFNEQGWRIDRISETEMTYAYRNTAAKVAVDNPIIHGLKIIDFDHGNPGEHERHKCYQYAHADEHGMGEGVYPVGTLKIRNPHPQCRSILVPVVGEEYFN